MLKHCHKIRTDHKPGLNLHQTIRDESSLDRGHCCDPLWKLPCASPSWWRHIPRFIIWIYMTWASVIASWCSQKINLEPCLAWKISSSEKKDSTSCPLCFFVGCFFGVCKLNDRNANTSHDKLQPRNKSYVCKTTDATGMAWLARLCWTT